MSAKSSGQNVRDAVFAACDAHLFEQQRIPTYDELRTALGGTGSNTTLTRYRREWEAALAARIAHSAQRPDTPPAVWKASMALWDTATAAARETAEGELAEARDAMQAGVEAAEERAGEAERSAKGAAQQLEALSTRLDRADGQHQADQERIGSLRAAFGQVEARLKAAQEQLDEANKQHAALERAADEARNAAAADRSVAQAAHTAETDRLHQALDAARTDAARERKDLTAEITARRGEREALHDQLVEVRLSARDAQRDSDSKIATLTGQLERLADDQAATNAATALVIAGHERANDAHQAALAQATQDQSDLDTAARQARAELLQAQATISALEKQVGSYEKLLAARVAPAPEPPKGGKT